MLDLILPLSLFAFSMAVTPGPNNVMVTASGATFGLRRTLPHLLGISVGFPVMILILGVGFGAAVQAAPPWVQELIRIVGAVYLLYLAWKIATAKRAAAGAAAGTRPFTFMQAALFQWINPKAWIIALGALATFTRGDAAHPWLGVLLVSTAFLVMSFVAVTFWAACGVAVGRLLHTDRSLAVFNITMALLLVASLALVFE